VKELLYDTLHMKKIINRTTHKVTSNEAALLKLKAKYPQHERILSLLLEHREKAKLLDSFLGSKLIDKRLITSYNAAGTVNGRLSSQKTLFGYGANVQQTPKGPFRRMFIAPRGKKFIKLDLSQAEARAVAWFAQITPMIERFIQKDFDIHRWTAALFHGKAEKDITKEERQLTKSIVHGINYGRGPNNVSLVEGLPLNIVKQSFMIYNSTFPQLELWHNKIKNELYKTRRLVNPIGRQRIFMGRLDEETFRSAYGFLPQSLVVDIINKALVNLTQILPEYCHVVLQVHDELVVEAVDYKVPECIELMRTACEIPIMIPPVIYPLIIPAEIGVGDNWYDTVGV